MTATTCKPRPSPFRVFLRRSAAVVACLVVTVGSFFAVQPLIDLARHAVAAIGVVI